MFGVDDRPLAAHSSKRFPLAFGNMTINIDAPVISGGSAGDFLALLAHRWTEAIKSMGQPLTVSFNIVKAFDRVWRRALLLKLSSYELPQKLSRWIGNFLTRRRIKVAIDGICSNLQAVNAGVLQS
ncbi:hypothetical protein EVAR_24989_1 [Eumeta japonica]|uniref:Reverse transcriptase domain-containing protein n=1 Tax=Eumeta variegata TaxID=151549 RepID=A0A4C1XK55_EUMVA|nr:hypothetical protein EVAR_24989_1 [Eumeta japonica]